MAAAPESEVLENRRDVAQPDASRIQGDGLATFLSSGIYRLQDEEQSSVVFVDPVRLLNRGYTQFRVSSSCYYSRSFRVADGGERQETISPPLDAESRGSRKRKRMQKKNKRREAQQLNEKEKAAERRHQEARPFLLRAHEALLRQVDLLSILPEIVRGDDDASSLAQQEGPENDFIELGRVWQAPMYEMTLHCLGPRDQYPEKSNGFCSENNDGKKITTVFNTLVTNKTDEDVVAECLGRQYILPRKCNFHMSDLKHIFEIIPAHSDDKFNLIVLDPPWENRSAIQKAVIYTWTETSKTCGAFCSRVACWRDFMG